MAPTHHRGPNTSQPSDDATITTSGGKKWASNEDWEKQRKVITDLYVKENYKLREIHDYISREHGFYATPKMYKTRFRRWNLWKNTKAADVAAHNIPPSALSALLTTTPHLTPPAKPVPLSPSSPALALDATLRAVRAYFATSLAARWAFASPASCDLAGGAEACRLAAQFHERFKTAAGLLASPVPAQAVSGMRMTRICFAELQGVMDGGLGPEDPIFLILFLIVLQALRRKGLRGIEVRLVGYAAELGGLLPAARPGRGVWAGLRDLVVSGAMDDEVSLRISQVLAELCARELGTIHAKTLEVLMCGYCNFDKDTAAQEMMYLGMLNDLDTLGTFDERHAGVRLALVTFYNMFEMHAKVAPIVLGVVEDPWMLEESKKYRGVTYKLYSELGISCKILGELEVAERAFRDAIGIAKWELSQGTANKASVLEGLISLEEVLRELGREFEADECVAEREAMVREGLEGVGEEEGP
ncbi:Clr5 domain-containing protein [Lasiosphaeris hirsuta]|uniref:Clr5 domain-containing protein n=1 Tax=Lasiosphaeris hirsuta TaxID=260670 RepID=A0AA39ZPJ2_9PEZI|nr:Clr5 domain-containing protein [Lasiosphaeris hirsuta]